MLGDEGTEQFTVTTRVNGKVIGEQEIHDPFAHTTVTLRGIGHAWRALFRGIKVQVDIGGTHRAISAVMQLDPNKMQAFTEEHLIAMATRRSENGVVGYYASKENDHVPRTPQTSSQA